MGGRKKYHNLDLPQILEAYAKRRSVKFDKYSQFHMRLLYSPIAVIDIWTTEKYYIVTTNYSETGGKGLTERGGETGFVPHEQAQLTKFLDELLFAADLR